MKEFMIELYTQQTLTTGNRTVTHERILANTPQEAADKIRKEYKGCYIRKIGLVVQDWD